VIELDHPATQRWKLSSLSAAGIDASPVDHRAVNFERDDLTAVLHDVVDLTSPVLFWWLGVTAYLTLQAIEATLATLGTVPSAAVVLDHAAPLGAASQDERLIHQRRRERVAALGEPWISEFTPEGLQNLLARCGFTVSRPVHELSVIEGALGRTGQTTQSSHLMWAATGWPPSS
jgi:O-methyltransferase involved in polyketide biosynthesis